MLQHGIKTSYHFVTLLLKRFCKSRLPKYRHYYNPTSHLVSNEAMWMHGVLMEVEVWLYRVICEIPVAIEDSFTISNAQPKGQANRPKCRRFACPLGLTKGLLVSPQKGGNYHQWHESTVHFILPRMHWTWPSIHKAELHSYRKISLSLEDVRSDVIMILALWNLTGISAALLLKCMSNLRAIGKV